MDNARIFPDSGLSRDQLGKGLRVVFHKVYAIYYTYNETELTLVRVLHGARDVKALAQNSVF